MPCAAHNATPATADSPLEACSRVAIPAGPISVHLFFPLFQNQFYPFPYLPARCPSQVTYCSSRLDKWVMSSVMSPSLLHPSCLPCPLLLSAPFIVIPHLSPDWRANSGLSQAVQPHLCRLSPSIRSRGHSLRQRNWNRRRSKTQGYEGGFVSCVEMRYNIRGEGHERV